MNLIAHAALTEQALHALYLRGLDAAQTAGLSARLNMTG